MANNFQIPDNFRTVDDNDFEGYKMYVDDIGNYYIVSKNHCYLLPYIIHRFEVCDCGCHYRLK